MRHSYEQHGILAEMLSRSQKIDRMIRFGLATGFLDREHARVALEGLISWLEGESWSHWVSRRKLSDSQVSALRDLRVWPWRQSEFREN